MKKYEALEEIGNKLLDIFFMGALCGIISCISFFLTKFPFSILSVFFTTLISYIIFCIYVEKKIFPLMDKVVESEGNY